MATAQQPIKSLKYTLTFTGAGVKSLVPDRQNLNNANMAVQIIPNYFTYLGENVDTWFTDIIIDPVDSGLNGAYCIENDDSNSITVDDTSFNEGVKRFLSTDVVKEIGVIIRRVRIYADGAGTIDVILEFNN
jgi:hypothetical protein